MADFLVYWKNYWKDIAADANAADWYWHTENESFFNEVEKGDRLWVVVSAGKAYSGQWRLLQRINVRATRFQQSKYGPFEIEGDPNQSLLFDLGSQGDFADVLHELAFASGKRITATGGAIGNTIQVQRLLASADSRLLDRYARTLRTSDSTHIADSGLVEFFRRASFYRYHPLFQEHEREYKIRLANALRRSQDLVEAGSAAWGNALQAAIESEDDNIIDWRLRKPFLEWTKQRPAKASAALTALWNTKRPLDKRLRTFCDDLAQVDGLHQSGARLSIVSTLLMALSPYEYPPVKVDSFNRAMKLAGWGSLYSQDEPSDRYLYAQRFMDSMIAQWEPFGVEFRDRLDVQGVVWCVSGGWPKVPLPAGWVNDAANRNENQQSQYRMGFDELESEPEGKTLTQTQKLVLSQARIGQGKFREELLRYWDCCCVTQCSHLSLLRASHIKPWKTSTNKERLDQFNGLLLSPNLDFAFDSGLVTFEDSGKIKISPKLSTSDREALGIHARLRLRHVSQRHLPYLQYHRKEVFMDK